VVQAVDQAEAARIGHAHENDGYLVVLGGFLGGHGGWRPAGGDDDADALLGQVGDMLVQRLAGLIARPSLDDRDVSLLDEIVHAADESGEVLLKGCLRAVVKKADLARCHDVAP
jgi:hypothetical protein